MVAAAATGPRQPRLPISPSLCLFFKREKKKENGRDRDTASDARGDGSAVNQCGNGSGKLENFNFV